MPCHRPRRRGWCLRNGLACSCGQAGGSSRVGMAGTYRLVRGGVMRGPACRGDWETPQGQGGGGEKTGEDGQEKNGHPHLPAPGCLPAGPGRGDRPQQDAHRVEGADAVQLPHCPQELDAFGFRCHAGPYTPTRAVHREGLVRLPRLPSGRPRSLAGAGPPAAPGATRVFPLPLKGLTRAPAASEGSVADSPTASSVPQGRCRSLGRDGGGGRALRRGFSA